MTNKYFKSKNDLRKLNPKCRIHLLVKYITGIEEELRILLKIQSEGIEK